MKRSLLVNIIFLVICSILYNQYGCSKITEYRDAKKREEQQKQDKESKETQKLLNEFSYRKEAVLLSLKYKIDEEKVFSILTETQELNNIFQLENIQGELEGKSITRNRLISLSEKFTIPIETLASIMIDYYAMQPCEQ